MIYTKELYNTIKMIVESNKEFSHIKCESILSMGKFDRGGSSGVVAVCNCIKLKGINKKLKIKFNKKTILYYIEFSFPRFLNQSPLEKLKTIVHELYHISPDFDGTLRQVRHGKSFEAKVERISQEFIDKHEMPIFLKETFDKVKFLKWRAKPRYVNGLKSFYEKDMMISTCNLKKYKEQFKYVYICPFCKNEFYMKKKASFMQYYYCKKCVKSTKGGIRPSEALVFSGKRA